jgi:hypothetical protein
VTVLLAMHEATPLTHALTISLIVGVIVGIVAVKRHRG